MKSSRREMSNPGRTCVLAGAVLGGFATFYFVPLSAQSQIESRLASMVGSMLGAAAGLTHERFYVELWPLKSSHKRND